MSWLWFALGALLPLSVFPISGALLEWSAPFGSGSAAYRHVLDRLTVADIVMLKAQHAELSGRMHIGLFGNSRVVEVSASDLGADTRRFFNFAVGGTSFRQSVALLEYLARRGTAPEIAVISVDNHELGFEGTIYWPEPIALSRWAILGWSRPDFASAVRDEIAISRQQTASYLNLQRLGQRMSYLLLAGGTSHSGYRADGSREPRLSGAGPSTGLRWPVVSEHYLQRIKPEMERLSLVAKKGTAIVLFESPLHPSLATRSSESANALRGRFQSACDQTAMTCAAAPVLVGPGHWYDCCHAPPALLGRFISTLITI